MAERKNNGMRKRVCKFALLIVNIISGVQAEDGRHGKHPGQETLQVTGKESSKKVTFFSDPATKALTPPPPSEHFC